MEGRPSKKLKSDPLPNLSDKELNHVGKTELWEDNHHMGRTVLTSRTILSNEDSKLSKDLTESPSQAERSLSESYQGQSLEVASRSLMSLAEAKIVVCSCCFPPKVFKNRSDKYYHIRVRKNKVEDKSSKKHVINSAEDFIMKQLPILTRAVLHDDYQGGKTLDLMTELLSDQLILIQDDIIAYCRSEIMKIDLATEEQNNVTALHVSALDDEEQQFFKDLSRRTYSRGACQDGQILKHGCNSSEWHIGDDSLELLHRSLQAKVTAIDHEMKRRATLATQIVLKYLLEKVVSTSNPG